MKNSIDSASAITLSWRSAGLLAVSLALALPAVVAAETPPCEDGSAVVEAVPLDSPLPAAGAASDGCVGFQAPAVKFLVGEDGKTYYIGFERSTGCATADVELRRWLECWTYQPARCGADPVTEVIEVELILPANPEWGIEPPCERETDRDPED